MIIPVSLATSSTNPKLPPGLVKISHDEFVLVELQGTLEVEVNHVSERDGRLVGKLKIDDDTNKPTLVIGHHLLEGKIVTLTKPLAILLRSNASPTTTDDKRDGDQNSESDVVMECGDSGTPLAKAGVVGWDVVAIVERKIVFSKRPMPIPGHQA